MLKKKLNPRGPKKRKLVTSRQTCKRAERGWEEEGEGADRARHPRGLPGGGRGRARAPRGPDLQLPEDEVGVEVELEGREELQLLRGHNTRTQHSAAGTATTAPSPPSPPPPGPPLTTAAVVMTQAVV